MTDRYVIRRDLQNIVEGPSGMHSTVPIIDATTLCEWLQKAWDKGFKAGCDACHPAPQTAEPAKAKRPKVTA